MTMMRIRGVWTTNLTAFLLGAGLYSSFVVFPQFAQLPKSTGFGFGASVVVSGVYLLPSTIGMVVVGLVRRPDRGAVRVKDGGDRRLGLLRRGVRPDRGRARLARSTCCSAPRCSGVGIGLAFAALGNLIVQAVEPHQTGAAGGMNTVMRTIGGAIGGQLSATFIAAHIADDGYPLVTGFTETFVMATAFLVFCTLAGFLIPGGRQDPRGGRSRPSARAPSMS